MSPLLRYPVHLIVCGVPSHKSQVLLWKEEFPVVSHVWDVTRLSNKTDGGH
jgi:hypothetical protein